MRINELLVESQQLDEGPFTQAVGKVGGKIAKGVANVGKDLKTGFKAGYSGEEPPAATDPAASVKKLNTTKTPAKSGGLKGFVDQFKKGFSQGRGETDTAATSSASSNTSTSASVDTAVEKQSKIGVGQINKIIPTLRTRDLLSLQANLEKAIASKKQKSTPVAEPEQKTGGAGAFDQMANQLTKAGA